MDDLYLRKTCDAIWDNYQYCLTTQNADVWDWIFVTASNDRQMMSFRSQIDERINSGDLPQRTHYVVLSDPDGKRVGSGGATLNVLKYINENSPIAKTSFDLKILIIHSGGDSKRIPQYSACGKLFSPVPRLLPNGRRAMLFDEIIISLSSIPARMNGGMLVVSGDALLIFDPFQVDFRQNKSVVALSVKKSITSGINHGVFLSNEKKRVVRFLHKQNAKTLMNIGAVNRDGFVDLDTGAIWLDKCIVSDLFSLISTDGVVDLFKFNMLVNENVRLNFYGDFVFPLAEEAIYNDYINSEGELPLNENLIKCRERIWSTLNRYTMSLISLSPAKFIHFGTTSELHKLVTDKLANYSFYNWSKNILTNIKNDEYSANNCFVSPDAIIGKECYLEDCLIGNGVVIGINSALSNIHINNVSIPGGVVLQAVKLNDSKHCVKIYGTNDNPKDYVSKSLFKNMFSASSKEELWILDLYPLCDTPEEAIEGALIVYKIAKGMASAQEIQKWQSSNKISLKRSSEEADTVNLFNWRKELENIVRTEKFIELLREKAEINIVKTSLDFSKDRIEEQIDMLLKNADNREFEVRIRIYQVLSQFIKKGYFCCQNISQKQLEDKCYDIIKQEISNSMLEIIDDDINIVFAKEEVVIELPVRINWGGGWSDTIPYCIEHGGTVLNTAIKLNGKYPIRVSVKRLSEPLIRFESIDLGCVEEFADKNLLLNLSVPEDAFLIHKGALIALGIIRNDNVPLKDILDEIGGGISISTHIDVPKGSGLGVSSICAYACVKALLDIFAIDYKESTIYLVVEFLEQIIGVGGGWQDQVGGGTKGTKLIKSKPGYLQDVKIEYVDISSDTYKELKERFVLVFSGQQRFAKNILREVMNKYISSDSNTIKILHEIQRIAVLMKFELEKGNISEFSQLLDTHWGLSKALEKNSSNNSIELIFEVCEDLIDARFICGAGGGGFLQMILKKGVTKETLRIRISNIFGDSGVEIWEYEFV